MAVTQLPYLHVAASWQAQVPRPGALSSWAAEDLKKGWVLRPRPSLVLGNAQEAHQRRVLITALLSVLTAEGLVLVVRTRQAETFQVEHWEARELALRFELVL